MGAEGKHTPGPWKFVPWHIAEGPSEVRAPEGWLICATSGDDNARLIAAAPELYEALKTLVKNVEHAFPALAHLGPLINARAALSKATHIPAIKEKV